MPTAIVTGATGKHIPGGSCLRMLILLPGITGRAIVGALSKDPKTWTKVYSMSRRQKPESQHQTSNIQHSTLDLMSSASDMAKQLKGIEAEYIFFCAYIAKGSEQGNVDANVPMLANLLEALAKTGAEKKLKRVILTAGLKQYGVQFGRPKNPMEETDPELRGKDRPPNFYYNQQDVLKEKSKGEHWDYVVTYPQDVIGVARGNPMNLATSLGLYAAVSKELNPNNEIPFLGSKECFLGYNCWTSSKLHAKFCLWAAFAEGVGGEGFNVINGDTESWQNMWPKLVKKFGGKIPPKHFDGPRYMDFEGTDVELAPRPPIEDYYSEVIGMKGEFKPNHMKPRIDPHKWAQRDDVKQAYEKLQKKYNLEKDAWEKGTWAFLAFVLGRDNDCIVSMTKARKLGFTGYHDTWESFEDAFDELEKEGILPPTK
jgi:nucleoside-diphosphate-sugar epimerase